MLRRPVQFVFVALLLGQAALLGHALHGHHEPESCDVCALLDRRDDGPPSDEVVGAVTRTSALVGPFDRLAGPDDAILLIPRVRGPPARLACAQMTDAVGPWAVA